MKRRFAQLGMLSSALLIVFVTVLVFRTYSIDSLQPEPVAFEPLVVDQEKAISTLSRAIQLQTVSHQEDSQIEFDAEPFLAMHQLLIDSYPATHAALGREVV